jgi:hypothetical protein
VNATHAAVATATVANAATVKRRIVTARRMSAVSRASDDRRMTAS